MIFFVTFLRALAACFITNSHYTGIYPSDIIANGGLIGDVIFFAVSGYCLYNIKDNFIQWYAKRIYRIYLPVLIVTVVYIVLGAYSLTEHSLAWYLVYPTYYHFIASIAILYIPFFLIMKWDKVKEHLPKIMLGIFLLALIYYILVYDKSYYHIDTVREWFVRILFFESMLLGAHFRKIDSSVRNNFSIKYPVIMMIAFVFYFGTKIIFSKVTTLSELQILNWVTIFILLWAVFRTFSGLDGRLEKMPGFVKKTVKFVAEMTLEIYVVQYVIIDFLRPHLGFPINWLVITISIVAAAYVLHLLCKGIYLSAEKISNFIKMKKNAI